MSIFISRKITSFLSLFLIFGFLNVSCSKKANDTPQYTTLEFDVDESLLAAMYVDSAYALSMKPPKGWAQVSEELLFQLKEKLTLSINDTSEFTVSPRQIFFSTSNHCVCSISEFSDLRLYKDFDSFIFNYQKITEWTFTDRLVRQGFYWISDFKMFQLLIMDDKMVNFKLVLGHPEGTPFQIDYIAPNEEYQNIVNAIESSIGSIHCINFI